MIADYLKTVPQWIAPKYALTLYAGFWANMRVRIVKNRLIRRFIHKYGVNMHEASRENVEDYSCFNDFFIRHLKSECRPISVADIISPVDGRISEIGKINEGQLFQAKGRYYSAQELLACDESETKQFNSGYFATLYLSPKDYHRVHMPMDATLQNMTYVPGKLFSVQPTTARVIPRLFARNERLVVYFQTKIGLMAMVLVGATIVGSIGTAWHGDVRRSRKLTQFNYSSNDTPATILQKAAEMGYFKLGSTVILLFSNDAHVQWRSDMCAGKEIRFGEALGDFA
ncbi:MAG: archaetidylserine decarboxylase [Legionellaceae bacterium]|nr:archaetidylserine decarboxylase [Legionellaceae bacterium]